MNTKHRQPPISSTTSSGTPRKKQIPSSLLAIAGLVFALAPTAQADTVVFNDSAQLNLAGRDVLAAVNFYDPNRFNDGSRTVTTIQGVDFDDFMNNVDDTGSPIALLAGAVGTTLSTAIPQSSGREFYTPNALFGTFSPASADNTQAENLANGGAYWQNGESSVLTFAFSGITVPTAVEVQMIGGGAWNQGGVFTVSVGGDVLGSIVEAASSSAQILTFETTTDASGVLVINVADTGNRYDILSGMTVTAGPTGPVPSLAITEIQYDPDAESGPTVTLTWRSRSNTTYKAFASSDLSDWGFALADMLGAAHDVIDDDGAHITVTFPLIDGLENVPDLFFRIEEEE